MSCKELQHSLGCYFIACQLAFVVGNGFGFDVYVVTKRYEPYKSLADVIAWNFRPHQFTNIVGRAIKISCLKTKNISTISLGYFSKYSLMLSFISYFLIYIYVGFIVFYIQQAPDFLRFPRKCRRVENPYFRQYRSNGYRRIRTQADNQDR